MDRRIEVYIDTGEPHFFGQCYVHGFAKQLSSTFVLDEQWAENNPDFLSMYNFQPNSLTKHYIGLPTFINDAAPDRWGRNLIFKSNQFNGRSSNTLDEYDYLIAVDDISRMGAFRFKTEGSSFLGENTHIPEIIDLPTLMYYANKVETKNPSIEAIKLLLDAGTSSLGGARPKATVSDGDSLYIAKFPSINDFWDVTRWEAVVLELAHSCGIDVPQFKVLYSDNRAILLEKRFDRENGKRIPFSSGFTLLDGSDGQQFDYFDLATKATTLNCNLDHFSEELFKRVCLSVVVNNTDDHMRNHGFLYKKGNWQLSPMYDVNINPNTEEHRSTSILGYTGSQEIDALLPFAEELGIAKEKALKILTSTLTNASQIEAVAQRYSCDKSEIAQFSQVIDKQICAIRDVYNLPPDPEDLIKAALEVAQSSPSTRTTLEHAKNIDDDNDDEKRFSAPHTRGDDPVPIFAAIAPNRDAAYK